MMLCIYFAKTEIKLQEIEWCCTTKWEKYWPSLISVGNLLPVIIPSAFDANDPP